MLVEVLADFGIGQSVHTERFSIVSGEARVFKVAGDVQHQNELLLLFGLRGGLLGRIDEIDFRAVAAAGAGRRSPGKKEPHGSKREHAMHGQPPHDERRFGHVVTYYDEAGRQIVCNKCVTPECLQ